MSSEEELVRTLEQTARVQNVGFALIRVGEEGFLATLPEGSGVTVLALGDAALLEALMPLATPSARENLLDIARQLNPRGIEHRKRGDPWTAYACYRFVMAVTASYGEHAGLQASTWSVWVLREAIRNVTVYGHEEVSPPDESALRDLGTRIAADARALLHTFPDRGDDAGRLLAYRLANLAADVTAARGILLPLCDSAAARGDWRPALVPLIQEIACAELPDVLFELIADPNAGRTFDVLWTHYTAARAQFQCVARDELASALTAAFYAFEFLRLRATAGGGTFSHHDGGAVRRQ